MKSRPLPVATGLVLLMLLTACGGGGSSSSSGPPPFTPEPAISITSDSLLPGTLQNHSYSVTLNAANGIGALHWSIAPISSTALFVDGLSIDPSTGVVSGTANFAGTAGFVAQVTDSGSPSHKATKTFTITAAEPLQAPAPQSNTVRQFQDIGIIAPVFQGGVFPFSFSLAGSFPPGLRLDRATGQIFGSATAIGNYPSTLIIQDSFSPPEIVSSQLTITVIPPALSVQNSLPSPILQNRPFSGRVIATGGIPPYHFALVSGSSLPPGLSPIDPNSGQIIGTPTTLGTFPFTVSATDSSSPPQTASQTLIVTVTKPLGRNDTVATATPIGNGVISATISPYIDPPGNAPVAGDNDYFKLVALAASQVHLETQTNRSNSGNPLDTVIEVVDGNGIRYSTCRQPGDTSSNFASACINDDISLGSNLDSALDFQVPGATNSATTFYVHMLDWRGDARPDMNYNLQVSGIVSPLSIAATPLIPAARGLSYSQQLSSADGIGTVAWSKTAGTLPPGLTLSATGAITGAAPADATYSFTVQASDSGNPPQTVTAQEVIQVVEPVKIVSSATWPDACVGQPYSFAVQTTGGLPPLLWSFFSNFWVGINLDQSNGVFSGFSSVTGTFHGSVGVLDATTHGDSQQVTLTVKQCP